MTGRRFRLPPPGKGSCWRRRPAYGLPPVALALASLGIRKTHGLTQRFAAEVQKTVPDSLPRPVAGADACYSTGELPSRPCRLGPAGAPLLATFLGDSHSDGRLIGLIEALPDWVTRELQRRLIADPNAPDVAIPSSVRGRPDPPERREIRQNRPNRFALSLSKGLPSFLLSRRRTRLRQAQPEG